MKTNKQLSSYGGLYLLFIFLITPVTQAADCIAVIPAGSGHAFWKAVGEGAKDAGKKVGVDIFFRGPSDESKADAQLEVINIAENEKKCKGLVLAPSNQSRAIDVARLKGKNIPTVYIDRDPGKADIVGVISTDNFAAGKLAAKKMAKTLGNKGNVAILRLKKGVQSTTLREDGFLEGAKESGLTVVVDTYVGSNIGEIRRNTKKALGNAKLNGVFTPNETTTIGVQAELQGIKGLDKIVHIGFDISDSIKDGIKAGKIYGVIVQRPYQMGYKGVMAIQETLKGQTVEPYIDTGVEFLTVSDL